MNYELFIIFERIMRLLSTFETNSPQRRRLTSRMWLLLNFVNENKSVTGTEVARNFMVKHPTATQLIDRAVKEGYIERKTSADDRRVQYLVVTKIGQKQRLLLGRLFDERASRALKYLSREEHQQLLVLMNKIAHSLESETINKRVLNNE